MIKIISYKKVSYKKYVKKKYVKNIISIIVESLKMFF